MKVRELTLSDVRLIEPRVYRDDRGYFVETWNQARYAEAGVPATFVQDNLSCSSRGVLRGLHFQWPHPQGKLVQVLRGEIFDVVVDVRVGSPTFGRSDSVRLTEEGAQLWVPAGFAHGFVAMSAQALVAYKCTAPYRPDCEATLRWDDPALGIEWPVEKPLVSPKDQGGLLLSEFPATRLPRMAPLAAPALS